MSYTSSEIQEQQDLVTALKTAYTQSVSTGGVIEFRQGSVWLRKASLAEAKAVLNEEQNTLFRMKSVS